MAVDLPPTNHLLSQLKTHQRGVLESITKANTAKVEQTLTALVKNIAVPTPKQVEVLTQQVKANPRSGTNLLLQSPALKLMQLNVEGKSLLTFTDKPLVVGEKILISQNNGQFQFKLTEGNTLQSTSEKQRQDARVHQILRSSTRSTLPIQQSLDKLLTQLEKIAAVEKQAGTSQLSSIVDKEIFQTLRPLLQQAKTPQQLTQVQQVKQSVENSGLFFEAKLAKALQYLQQPASKDRSRVENPIHNETYKPFTPSAGTNSSTKLDHLIETVLTKLGTTGSNQAPARTNEKEVSEKNVDESPASKEKMAESKTELSLADRKSITGDIKYLLLQAKQVIEKQLISISNPPTFSTSESNIHLLAKTTNSNTSLDAILQQWLRPKESGKSQQTNQTPIHEQVLRTLQKQVSAALASIQLRQVGSLSQQVSQTDSSTQSLNIDLPIKLNGEYLNLQLEFEEEWINQESEDDSKPGKIKQWNVTLNFDLPDAGPLYSRVKVVGGNDQDRKVSVQFWAEHSATLAEVEKKLRQLHKDLTMQGVNIDKLQCLPGIPQKKFIQFNYALVDVKT